jgi:hypothetical protein
LTKADLSGIRCCRLPVFEPDIRDDERSGEVILRLIELKNGTRLPECGSIDRKVVPFRQRMLVLELASELLSMVFCASD